MMLKIKDSIDLKELENYGFRYSLGEDWHYYFDNISLSYKSRFGRESE